MENKKEFVQELGALIARYARADVTDFTYSVNDTGWPREIVTIEFNSGFKWDVNVTCDSIVAIMFDIAKALM